jgi:AraC-like DNA-binding protein
MKPTAAQRRRVMRGIAVGLTLEQLADDLDVSIRTLRRAFASEIKTARVRVRLDTVDLLHKAANGGNVSAMKTLLEMADRWRPDLDEDEEDDNAWEDVGPNLARIHENGKTAGFED